MPHSNDWEKELSKELQLGIFASQKRREQMTSDAILALLQEPSSDTGL